MSLAEACGWSVLRSLLIALTTLPMAWWLCGLLDRSRPPLRRTLWLAVLAPYFAPELLVGYAYSQFSLSLVHHPVANGLFYAGLLWLKLVPVSAVVLRFSPPSALTPAAVHCRLLAVGSSRNIAVRRAVGIGYWLRGPGRSLLPAFAVVFLLSFQEFEVASLMGVTAGTVHSPASWTVWLFDAQVGGLLISDSLERALLPFLLQALVILPVVWLIMRGPPALAPPGRTTRTHSKWTLAAPACHLALAWVVVWGMPLALVLRTAAGDRPTLLGALRLKEEILTGLCVAVTVALAAYLLAGMVLELARRRDSARWLAAAGPVIVIPGLFGSLILGLVTLFIFQRQPLARLSDTPLPLLVAFVLFLLPRALLLQALMRMVRPDAAMHSARLLCSSPQPAASSSGRELVWQLRVRGDFWALVLLCYWGYWDLTLPSLLAPPGMVSAPVLLYNFMHYGQIAALTSMLFATLAVPLVLLLIAALARRHVLNWLV